MCEHMCIIYVENGENAFLGKETFTFRYLNVFKDARKHFACATSYPAMMLSKRFFDLTLILFAFAINIIQTSTQAQSTDTASEIRLLTFWAF